MTMPAGFPAVLAAGQVVSLQLFVPGKPQHQPRPRGRVQGRGEKAWVQFYEEKHVTAYKERVAETCRNQILQTPAVEIGSGGDFLLPFSEVQCLMKLRFNFEKPASYPKRVTEHVKKPDLDNLAKCVMDGVIQGRVLTDDNCITDLTIQKRYADDDHPEGVEIDITVMPVETV